MHRVWVERKLPERFLVALQASAQIVGCAIDSPDDPFCALNGAEAIIAGSRLRYDVDVFDRASSLRVVSRSGIGIDNVDIAAATARGIAVCNTPDAPTVSTVEHTLLLLLAVSRKLRDIDTRMRAGKTTDFFSVHTGTELRGRVLGVVGLGRIGGEVARLGTAFGMRVVGHDPFVSSHRTTQLGIEAVSTLEELLAQADFVSLHLPPTPETHHLFNREMLRRMKRGACLINCARGSLVDESALLEALQDGHLAGAGLDVFEQEPPPPDHPLLQRLDVIATPHIASATAASKDRSFEAAISQALQVLEGQRPRHLVNPEVWKGRRQGAGVRGQG